MLISQVLILAGGPATRLHPITLKVPKSMLEISGRPFIAYQLELLKRNDIQKVILCLGYLGEQIRDFVQLGEKFGLKVDYSFDGEKLLGTGGAVKKAGPILDEVFFCMYGDSYLEVDFAAVGNFFSAQNKKGLLTLIKNENHWDRSNIVYGEGKIKKYDKKNPDAGMKYVDYGLSILKREIFNSASYGEVFDLTQVYRDLIQGAEMSAFEVKERFFEIGSQQGLEETRKYLEQKSTKIKSGE